MYLPITAERTLTELDFARLKLRDGHLPPELEAQFEFPDVTPSREVAANVVTMNSQVEIMDLRSHQRQKLTLCYPADAQPQLGLISVLSPVGASLLGLRVGAIAQWRTPNGDECAAEIAALLFQPEASGNYTL